MKLSILLVGNFLSAKGVNRTMAEEFGLLLKETGYSVWTTSSFRSRVLRMLDMFLTTFRRRQNYLIACVEVYSGTAFLWAEMICNLLTLLRKPYVLVLHGGSLPVFARRRQERVKRLLQSAGAVISPSRYLQNEMRIYRNDIVSIPNPLILKNYSYRLRKRPMPKFIWLRAFHDIYNPKMAPLIIAILREVYPDVTLSMIGPDKGDGALQETKTLIEKLGLQKNVIIIPGIPKRDVPNFLEQSDIFINTTNVDNTPVSILEAMACGLCVVSTNVGGIPYLLDDEQDTMLIPPNDLDAATTAIKRILTEPGLAEKLSYNARRKVEQFDWSAIYPQWEAVFEEVLNA